MTEVLTYVELDIDFCANTYGVAPCTASIPTTGAAKCYNTKRTCQDRPNYNSSTVTLRFGKNTAYLPEDIPCIPIIKGVSFSPAIISLGEDLGQRATLSVTMEDIPHPDTGPGFDKYRTERAYDPFRQGTFFGKFRARQPFIRGQSVRLIRGTVGQAIEDMETRHYVVDSFDGPTPRGMYTLVAKDVLKLADDDRAKAPVLSQGRLNGAINSSVTSATLSPAGIGNAEYPASGKLCLGGSEVCTFTRSSDTVTLTRGAFNTTARAHAAGDRVQMCLEFSGNDAAEIIYVLLNTYAGIDSAFLPLAAWQTEVDTYIGNVYSTLITEPTGVNKLVSELVEQSALAVWWDDSEQLVRLQVLRPVPTSASQFTPDNTFAASLQTKEQPERRLSQVWSYFARRDPTRPLDEAANYRESLLTADAVSESDYGSAMIKSIFSRWIGEGGQVVTERMNNRLLGRYRDPPRRFNFEINKEQQVELGGGYRVASHVIQDETGALSDAPVQITRLASEEDRFKLEAEEVLFTEYDQVDVTDRVVVIGSNTFDVNLRTMHDGLYSAPTDQDVIDGVNVTFIINAGVVVGCTSPSSQAIHVGSWPSGFPVTVQVLGRIQGAGGSGRGVDSVLTGYAGNPGGIALYTRHAIDLDDASGEIWGGGGGGGGGGHTFGNRRAGGGGGAGTIVGPVINENVINAPDYGDAGTATAGGQGGDGNGVVLAGDGGGPGLPGAACTGGSSGKNGAGGAAGKAIDGFSYVTTIGSPGDRRGGMVN